MIHYFMLWRHKSSKIFSSISMFPTLPIDIICYITTHSPSNIFLLYLLFSPYKINRFLFYKTSKAEIFIIFYLSINTDFSIILLVLLFAYYKHVFVCVFFFCIINTSVNAVSLFKNGVQ